MDNIKDDKYYVKKIKEQIEFINMHMKNKSLNDLTKDELLQDSMLFRLTQLHEYSKGLSEEYKNKTNIPWNKISGIRNRIVHDYGEVDITIIYDALTISIPELLDEL
ncbi:MAG: DUF86 domain-containing protein [Clostridia bacterium]|nr:DUF86 domain-containing protein [Clostridia bacterium]